MSPPGWGWAAEGQLPSVTQGSCQEPSKWWLRPWAPAFAAGRSCVLALSWQGGHSCTLRVMQAGFWEHVVVPWE